MIAMKREAVEVRCYAGHKADEAPRRFRLQGGWIEVAEVVDRWQEAAVRPGWPRADCFRVRAADGEETVLKHDLDSGRWRLVAPR